MDLDELGNRISNLTFYDLKSAWTQAKNYALNVSDIEAKVNEATSDDPWGASSTLMQEIAAATHTYQDFNEIMPAIFRNFMEKEAREWRQIYKSLTLLEYITKHGSERVIDDARAHLGTIKILKNFHYIDEAGKDQGLNVRNRAKELSELLGDVERIRQERRKARANRQKYQGVSNSDFVPGSGGGRYGGFGSDSYNPGADGVGGSSTASGAYPGDASATRESFDEYDAGDDDAAPAGSRQSTSSRTPASRGPAAPPKKQQVETKVADLFNFDDDEPAVAAATAAPLSIKDSLGDDFDDFQAAPVAAPAQNRTTLTAAPVIRPVKVPAGGDLFDFMGGGDSNASSAPSSSVTSPSTSRPSAGSSILSPSSAQQKGMQSTSSTASLPALTPQQASRPSAAPSLSKSTASSGLSGFDDLWASSTGGSAIGKSGANAANGKKTMADLAKEKSGAGVWGGGTASAGQQQQKKDVFDFL